ncbi:HD domain-containing phosphohydrolase [Thiomicrorhabdus xiamenensis]|uniref:HD domain-containing protein n=1 Tax=Thiomicrorhabdus xiamenensis TaxID=2739063 RepID=A0A7D4NNJ9_9GAMM|nr:HD domain-containing phosphohydrolase [Thiomicrorhabdus xiamenensis]QKI88793.1 HD domain-containing protein [Thiomicrorhabdus xiamenensis]
MLTVLGASGSLDQGRNCTSFLVGEHILIDAGSVMQPLGKKSLRIEHVLLTHSHFDHIADLPFLIETHFAERRRPVKLYASRATLLAVKEHLFNGVIWPEFQTIEHPKHKIPMLEFVEVEEEVPFRIGAYQFTPVAAKHTVPTFGFLVKKGKRSCLISGDTYVNPELTQRINRDPEINSLIIETSFPSSLNTIAERSQHLTPELLKQQLNDLNRPLAIYLYHLKPAHETEIRQELQNQGLPISKILATGDSFSPFAQYGTFRERIFSESSEKKQLRSLLHIAQSLSAQTNTDRLIESILKEAMDLSGADAGTLYTLSEDKQKLQFTVVQNRSLKIKMGGTQNPISWEPLSLYHRDGTPNGKMAAVLCALSKEAINIPDAYSDTDFDFSGTRAFDDKTGYRSQSMLVIPLLDRDQRLLGVLQLINKQDKSGQVQPFNQQDQQNTMALASQAAISLNNSLLIKRMEELFEAFAHAITKAFDEKSSFTGIHIRQVAKLATLIAKAIDEDETVYKDVNYTPEMHHTIKIAALVHDVGKIATPESILQKATKLEAIYDRIESVRLRFAILERDLRLQALQKRIENLGQAPSPVNANDDRELHSEIQELYDQFEFLKSMNTGREFVEQTHLQKIQKLAQISFELDGKQHPLLSGDEVVNLSIQRGTLNDAERETIMDHARISLEILQTLPFPEQYERIVDIAANHHEKLDGSGYPRGLTASELTLEDHIMILADLYEALSSPERPYKQPLSLQQVANILCSMANHGEIDKTLLRFFFESGAYQNYNTELNPEQLTDFELKLN